MVQSPLEIADADRSRSMPNFIQLCFVVADLEAAMSHFAEVFNAGPWFVSSGFPASSDPTIYRGAPAPLDTDIALGYAGAMMFELACPRPGSRSIFREVADLRGYGIHHLGFGVTDFDRAIRQLVEDGTDILTTSKTPRGARIAMFDAAAPTGMIHEYIEILPASRRFYEFMQTAAKDWDRAALRFEGTIPDFS